MDAVNDPSIEEIVVKKSAQVGYTAILGNIVGYFIDQDPSPILMVQPTLDMAEAWSKDRFTPMVRDTPALKGKIADPKSRNSGNTILHKIFAGGHLTISGANSPSSLASRPIRVSIKDEVDRYPFSAGAEGDPLALADKRTTTFWNRKKIAGSTPTVEGQSRIDELWQQSDQRFFHVPCPRCGEMQPLKWERVKWEKGADGGHRPETARYSCAADCGALWTDVERGVAVSLGEWRATMPFKGIAGFHIWEAYSPWVGLADTVRSFLKAKDNPETLKTWTNTALGETWAEKGEAPEWNRLFERRSKEFVLGEVPEWAGLITIGADCQRNRVEASVWAWGPNKQSALIAHEAFDGDSAKEETLNQLDELIEREYVTRAGRILRAAKLAIDTGDGYSTMAVYDWARKRPKIVMAVKGVDRFDSSLPVAGPTRIDIKRNGARSGKSAQLWTVAVSFFKSELYSWLNLDSPVDGKSFPAGFIHLPDGTNDEWIKQLVAEQLVKAKNRRGFSKLEWRKIYHSNEALDCRNYARAAAFVIGVDRWDQKRWDRELMRSARSKVSENPISTPEQGGAVERREITRSGPDWISGGDDWF